MAARNLPVLGRRTRHYLLSHTTVAERVSEGEGQRGLPTDTPPGSRSAQARRAGEGAGRGGGNRRQQPGGGDGGAGSGPGAWRRSGGAGRRLSPRCQPRAAGPAEKPPSPARPAPEPPPAGEGGSMSGGRSGRSAVKMEAPFYPEEGLELLPDFVPLPGFGTAGGPGADAAAGQKLLLGAGKKRDLPAAAPAPLPGPFALRPPAGARGSAAALRLLPPPPAAAAAPPPTAGSAETGSGGGAAAARGGPEAALGSAAELPLLKLPPAADLEQLLIQGGAGLGAGSPGPAAPGAGSGGAAAAAGPFLYRQPVTQEQEGFADGFVKALADLHKQNQLLAAPPPPLSAPGPCCTARPGPPGAPAAAATDPPAVYTNLSGFNPAGPLSPSGSAYPSASAPPPPGLAFGAAGLGSGRLPAARSLEEPQTVPEVPPSAGGEGGSSAPTPPSLSPLDAESQERLKAERKRLRNRIAASKCRRRKLERIARLEEKVKALKGQNAELAATANLLRAQVTQLQGRVRSHLSSGCHISAAGHPPPHAAAQPRETPPEAAAAAPETSAC
ncbi:transcription factor JunD-like [Hirundo rustica]|uniref:transcription factor JunD-like n=1 Tax=Hirundo rustica TaxID=43150 RepID=UPI001A942A8C|nr:transcription factor JunD-like [Hirundo rustica]